MNETDIPKILITVHFLDGQTWESVYTNHPAFNESSEEFAKHQISMIFQHKSWYKMPDNSFLPASRIAKATWELVQQ